MNTALGDFIPFLSLSFLSLFSVTNAFTHTSASLNVLPAPGCPESCSVVGSNPSNWTWIVRQSDLSICDQPILFDFHFGDDSTSDFVVRSCAVLEPFHEQIPSSNIKEAKWTNINVTDSDAVTQSLVVSNSCGASQQTSDVTVQVGPAGAIKDTNDANAAVKNLASYMTNVASCGFTVVLSKVGETVAALYAGADVYPSSVGPYLDSFTKNLEGGSQTIQSCDSNSKQDTTIGIYIVDSLDELEDIQRVFKTWSKGDCLSANGEDSIKTKIITLASSGVSKRSDIFSSVEDLIAPRGNCRTIQVKLGDGCGSLASRCDISGADFTKYNPGAKFCSNLKAQQHVCCSAGTLPDYTPKPQADGTCFTYTIQPNDNCADIAAGFSITQDEINTFNKNTWAWAGCGANDLKQDQIICLSKGNTPMPAPLSNAVCGPQKPGTKAPPGDYNGWNLTELNPCPLNACCSGWGFCGTTEEFCTKSPAKTNAPGAFLSGKNGCISNCGTKIVNNEHAPDKFLHVAYYEVFNLKRECLNMDVTEINDASLTHVHFAFAGLTADFDIAFDNDDYKAQFEKFVKISTSYKKVLSFGGWAESTDAATFQRYRDVVKPGNRDKFATNMLAFFNKYKGLDGIDFDWEYPGATDIPGVPPGTGDETNNYLAFLKLMKNKIGDKSLSIALPASYWYLKAFPIDKMAEYLSYFIYMTYDLHGQWDYGNANANVGCPGGDCLRSHVNKTETENALVMVTKAGVPANKVLVGISSYGRSFGMIDPSCTGPMCKYGGSFDVSTAEAGQCTNTSGYISNAELNDIMSNVNASQEGYKGRVWYDTESASDMMVYGTTGKITTWVAYMADDTKNERIDWVKGLNFGGVTDWAVDLQQWNLGVDTGSEEAKDLQLADLPKGCPSDNWPDSLDKLQASIDSIDVECRSQAVVWVLLKTIPTVLQNYKDASESYDEYFGYYSEWVKDNINDSLEKFMWGDGMKYMDCKWTADKADGGSGNDACTKMVVKQGQPSQGVVTITYTVRDEDGFYNALQNDYGILKDWIVWEETSGDPEDAPCPCPVPGHCIQCNKPHGEVYHNWPQKAADDAIKVPNLKSVIDTAVPNITALQTVMLGSFTEIRLGAMDATDADMATAYSMPVFMLADTTEQMKNITKIGKEQKKADDEAKVSFILDIVSIVLMIIPFAGEAVEAIGGVANVARAALVMGEAGNAALSVYDIVKDPSSAPFAILGLLMGADASIVGKSAKTTFSKAAAFRHAMSDGTLKSFSKEFQANDKIVQDIVKACKA
ncbi:CAZyme family GH18 [Penicillium roqueforti]|uniref:CAZyme family GH18 n=1 Tax=Penicillium roqueforti TaxID=5082 RepID=UPI00190D5193|nr:CAZyme family GH18 [Penicillium roqueforti]KAF9252734.1 CAZyme family GH18 [Penicillium roqueforti]KAI2675366.1 CAZyme family GH18 [Penicillium roqueforti]KAI2686981.1 CAZyme family GH18 [Penicillium roqueforti]KAI2724255.1 CAZyme family GH18 [Penicillium roqueforti]KAI3132031.1 CAZyme family GH18 [Penicillium roqueforti]